MPEPARWRTRTPSRPSATAARGWRAKEIVTNWDQSTTFLGSPLHGAVLARCALTSSGPYDAAKPKNAATQATAAIYSSCSLHAGSSDEQIRASAALTTAAY